jgi:hypothetical protein
MTPEPVTPGFAIAVAGLFLAGCALFAALTALLRTMGGETSREDSDA